jgi:hypothetical protein
MECNPGRVIASLVQNHPGTKRKQPVLHSPHLPEAVNLLVPEMAVALLPKLFSFAILSPN